jgi:hypothetical protein
MELAKEKLDISLSLLTARLQHYNSLHGDAIIVDKSA